MKRVKICMLLLAMAGILFCCAACASGESKQMVVKIGFVGPLSGEYGQAGQAARQDFERAIEEANNSGDFPYSIEVLVADDQSSEQSAMAGAKLIVSDPLVVGACAFWPEGPAAATIPVFKQAQIPLLLCGGQGSELYEAAQTLLAALRACGEVPTAGAVALQLP